jgi:CHASE2 domain-containing sensor protein
MLRGRRPATRLTLAAAILVAAACAAALPLGVGAGLARQATDAFFPRGPMDERLLVVAIDRRSLAEPAGQTWSYRQVAELVEALAGAGAGVIVLDVDAGRLSESDPGSDAARGDEVLADAIRRAGNVVALVPPADLEPTAGLPRIRQRSDIIVAVVRAARARGLGNLTADPGDRVVRSVPLVGAVGHRAATAGRAPRTGAAQGQARPPARPPPAPSRQVVEPDVGPP